MDTSTEYGLWGLAILNAAFFIYFAWSFAKPLKSRDWRSFGMYSAFIVALFAEMYGYPLTLYLLSGWLTTHYPGVNWLSHDAGHIFEEMFGWRGNPHFGPFHLLSFVFIGLGFWLLAAAWPPLYAAQKHGRLATKGPYSRVRHPQYIGFVSIMFGFLLQWPTLVTLAMFPVMVVAYWRLAKHEEADTLARFGDEYRAYAARVPAFIPHWKHRVTA